MSPVDEVVEKNDVSRSVALLKGSACRCGKDVCASFLFECPDVGTVVYSGWIHIMLPAMP